MRSTWCCGARIKVVFLPGVARDPLLRSRLQESQANQLSVLALNADMEATRATRGAAAVTNHFRGCHSSLGPSAGMTRVLLAFVDAYTMPSFASNATLRMPLRNRLVHV